MTLIICGVGVKEAHQGQGNGSKLIQQIMQESNGKALHLQTSNPRNFPLYERLGFDFEGDYNQAGYAVKIYTYYENWHNSLKLFTKKPAK